MDDKELARRQYILGLLNRRMAEHMTRLDDVFTKATGDHGVLTLLCGCGRPDCDRPLLTVPAAEYEPVRQSPHRFVIAPGHTTEIDEVVHMGDGYAIVELAKRYRQDAPPA